MGAIDKCGDRSGYGHDLRLLVELPMNHPNRLEGV